MRYIAYGKNRSGPKTDPCGKPKKSIISVNLSALPLSAIQGHQAL